VTGRDEELAAVELGAAQSNGLGRARTFPSSWGFPQGEKYSEERAAWVRSHVKREVHTQHFRHLADVNGRLLIVARSAYLDSIRHSS
jgi:hypothetical protein